MLQDPLNKSWTLRRASEVTATARLLFNPRAWLGAWALRRSVSAERSTLAHTDTLTAKERKSYIPRDLPLSYLQARHEERVLTGDKMAEGISPDRGFDYNWATTFLAELGTHLVRRLRFTLPRSAPQVTLITANARIILVGDWGTGEGPAQAVAQQMRREIDDAAGRDVHVAHLGDVYYAGTRWESQHRFLDHWPVRANDTATVRSWCLNGNHDMYSAGEGLFQVILADNRFAHQRTERNQRTSELHLRNDHWDIVGLDTSWKFRLDDIRGGQGYLDRRQRRWLSTRLAQSGRRRMFLSHHQPFTVHTDGAGIVPIGNLLNATTALRTNRDIDAWFWGHEHRLITFDTRDGVRHGACIGHGAILEEPAQPAPSQPGTSEFLATFTDDDGDQWRMPGFAVIDLHADSATVRYIDMNGTPWKPPLIL